MIRIYDNIKPSEVIHELIFQPIGTYLYRTSTENDDILSEMKFPSGIPLNSYVVLSVRVDENKYHTPIMNYRLPLDEHERKETLNAHRDQLPELENECEFFIENFNWKIDSIIPQNKYSPWYPNDNDNNSSEIDSQYIVRHQNKVIRARAKQLKIDEQEFDILKTLCYFHIISFYGITECNQQKYLVYRDHGQSLKERYSRIKFSDDRMTKQLVCFAFQIACGMMYLEKKKIIHRNLHANSIVIDEVQILRIAGFDYAIDDKNKRNSRIDLKQRFLAPECLPATDSSIEYSTKSDIWAYGLIFMELILDSNEQYIYPDILEFEEIIQYVKEQREIHPKPDECPEDFYEILIQCWKYDSDERISFEQIRNAMFSAY